MKRFFHLTIALLLITCSLLSACGEAPIDQTSASTDTAEAFGTADTTSTTTSEPKPQPVPENGRLFIDGVDISKYTIVYAQSPLEKTYGSQTGKTAGEDLNGLLLGENAAYDFDYQSAVRLQRLIQSTFGTELPVVKDADVAESKYEILVGMTTRMSSRKMTVLKDTGFNQSYRYVCSASAHKTTQYVICGGFWGVTWHAVDRLEAYLTEHKDSATPVDLTDAGDLSGTYEIKTVACIGDSVLRGSQAICDGDYADTDSLSKQFGSTATSYYIEHYLSYPAVVQRSLWKDYAIFNFGQGYASMRDYFPGQKDTGPYYYNDTAKFQQCLKQAQKEGFHFDLLIIQLGGNDGTKVGTTWTEELKADFLKEAKSLIDQVKTYSPNLKTVFMNVPHRAVASTNKASKRAVAMRAVQQETAQALRDQGYDVYLYNLYEMMKENLTDDIDREDVNDAVEKLIHKAYYNFNSDSGKDDYTHPNYKGYAKMAEHVTPMIRHLLDGKRRTVYMIDLKG